MTLELSSELGLVILLTSCLGGLGGFVFDVVTPLKKGSGGVTLDYKIDMPSFSGRTLDLGFLGPVFVGVVAALVAVAAAGIEGTGNEASIELHDLIWMALVGGFGGSAVLKAFRSQLVRLIEARARAIAEELFPEIVDAVTQELRSRWHRVVEMVRGRPADELESRADDERIRMEDAVRAAARTALSNARPRGAWRGAALAFAVVVALVVIAAAAFLIGRAGADDPVATSSTSSQVDGGNGGDPPPRNETEGSETERPPSPTGPPPDLAVTIENAQAVVENVGDVVSGPFDVVVLHQAPPSGTPATQPPPVESSSHHFEQLLVGGTARVDLPCFTGDTIVTVVLEKPAVDDDPDNNEDRIPRDCSGVDLLPR